MKKFSKNFTILASIFFLIVGVLNATQIIDFSKFTLSLAVSVLSFALIVNTTFDR